MRTFCTIKNKIKRYQEEVNLLNSNIAKELDTLKKEIGSYWLETKFLVVKLEDGTKDYYYLSSFDILNPKWFYGIRVSGRGNIEFGKLSFDIILHAAQYETIDNERFFGKLKSLGINLDDSQDIIAIECNKFKPIIVDNCGDKENAVGYCRLSQTSRCKNKYDRQTSLITNFVKRTDEYNLSKIFTETITGVAPLKERSAILDMIDYCSCKGIHTVIVSELNRFGRKKDIILSVIAHLMKHNISEIYVLKENILINEEFLTNNYRKLNTLAKSCEDEYENIRYRMKYGYKAYVEKRKEAMKNGSTNIPVLGKPKNYVKPQNSYREEYVKEIDLLSKPKMSLRQVQAITGTSVGTLRKLKKMFCLNNTQQFCH